MNRLVPIVLLVLLVGFAVYLFGSGGGSPTPSPVVPVAPDAATASTTADASTAVNATTADTGETDRREVTTGRTAGEDLDPAYLAALSGFRGRVLGADGKPVEDTLVALYEFSPDSILVPNVDVFVDQGTAEPKIDAGETRTDSEGRFELLRVLPRSMYLLHAAVDSDAPAWRIVQRTPGPGEVVDLGDIVLANLAVLTGEVFGPDGEPVEGALVRAVDLPGSVLTFVPIERLDPTGALIVTEDGGHVIEAPPWFEKRFEELPLARTTTGADGKFRLTGVVPGSNLVAVTKPGLLSNVRPRVLVEPGEEKDLGRLRLPEGEFAAGKVVDEDGKPIVDAQVLVASRSPSAPVHFASFATPTDEQGKFELGGMPPGEAIVAARRDKGEPWKIVGPGPVAQDFTVELPSRYDLTLLVVGPDGEPIPKPRLQVLRGQLDQGAVEMAMWGVTRPIPLDDRTETTDKGATVLRELPRGSYSILVAGPGCATTGVEVELTADAERTVELKASIGLAVKVLDPSGAPVRHASIYVEARGPRPRLPNMPVNAGFTNKAGELRIDDVRSSSVKVSASYPAYGDVESELKLPSNAPLVLQFAAPGSILGVLTDGGAVPAPGKWTVVAMRRHGSMDAMPKMRVPDAEGKFHFTALTPGDYQLAAIPTLDVVTSPGKLMEFMMTMSFQRQPEETAVSLAPGAVAQVAFDATAKPPVTGPSARISGFVTLDGRPATNCFITGWAEQGHRLMAEIDTAGRFDLGLVPAGSVNLQVQAKPSGDPFQFGPRGGSLWQTSMKLEDGKDQDLTIELSTTTIEGVVLLADGSPAVGARVSGNGRLADASEHQGYGIQFRARTDDHGRFQAEQVAAGTWSIQASLENQRGGIDGIVAEPGVGARDVRIELHRTYRVKGTCDLSAFGDKPRRWAWLQFMSKDPNGPTRYQGSGIRPDGSFEVNGLEPGTYTVQVYVQTGDDDGASGSHEDPNPIVVTDHDVEGVTVRPVIVPEQPPQPERGR